MTGPRARRRLLDCWHATTEHDAAQRCVLAHYLADLEPALDDEVAWDERALEAFARVQEGDLAPIGIPSARGLAPSLHLNLGDGYRRQGRLEDARSRLEAGIAGLEALGDDGYGSMIRQGLERLADWLSAAGVRTRDPGR
jgi:hypothetical protein